MDVTAMSRLSKTKKILEQNPELKKKADGHAKESFDLRAKVGPFSLTKNKCSPFAIQTRTPHLRHDWFAMNAIAHGRKGDYRCEAAEAGRTTLDNATAIEWKKKFERFYGVDYD